MTKKKKDFHMDVSVYCSLLYVAKQRASQFGYINSNGLKMFVNIGLVSARSFKSQQNKLTSA